MDMTTEAVRLGLDMAQLRAQVASANIAAANVPGAPVYRADFADAVATLRDVVRHPGGEASEIASITADGLRAEIRQVPATGDGLVRLDDQVAELGVDGVTYRALSEGLSRHFALMQLAIGGR